MDDVDMRFDVIKGAPFQWLKLKTTNIVGTLRLAWADAVVDKCGGGVLRRHGGWLCVF